MPTLTVRNLRTISGYVVTLLEYPRWVIEREVDFTNCHRGGHFDATDRECGSCHFGKACRWLHLDGVAPRPDVPLPELLQALGTATDYLRSTIERSAEHYVGCECDACPWLAEARGFLRTHRHHS